MTATGTRNPEIQKLRKMAATGITNPKIKMSDMATTGTTKAESEGDT
jgi:hypothetical protein